MTPRDTAGHIIEDFRAILKMDTTEPNVIGCAWAHFYLKTSQRAQHCIEDLGSYGVAAITQEIARLTDISSPEMLAFLDALKSHRW